jgi:DDE superfamily endonuclease
MGCDKHMLIALWYFANNDTYRSVADRFGVCESSAMQAVRRVTLFLTNLAPVYIRWPRGERLDECKSGFFARAGMPCIVGAIDGSHIPIIAPSNHPEDYINRKGFHSVLLQAVVDHRKLFTDVYVGQPGSLHDARVLRKSPLYHNANTNITHFFQDSTAIVGDAAYPSLRWIIPPFRDNGRLTATQRDFNHIHSSTRIIVENAFALLKGRFRKLKYVSMNSVDEIPSVVLSCCVLHNICILGDDDSDIAVDDTDNDDQSPEEGTEDVRGLDIRQRVVDFMYIH